MNELNGDDDAKLKEAQKSCDSVEKTVEALEVAGHLNSVSDVNTDATELKDDVMTEVQDNVSERGADLNYSSGDAKTCLYQKHERERNSSECKSDDQVKKNNSEFSSTSRKHHGKKHRVRLNRKRKWKPYCKLTWQERMKVDERDTRRAQRLRNQRLACGLTLAPNNTTQFLMNDHDVQEPDYESIQNGHKRRESNSLGSSDEYYSSPDDEEEYITHQFMEEYETVHDEYLNELSKLELVQQWMGLEDKIEGLEKQLKVIRDQRQPEGQDLDPDAEIAKIQVFRQEIEKLSEENIDLYRQNKRLERHLPLKS